MDLTLTEHQRLAIGYYEAMGLDDFINTQMRAMTDLEPFKEMQQIDRDRLFKAMSEAVQGERASIIQAVEETFTPEELRYLTETLLHPLMRSTKDKGPALMKRMEEVLVRIQNHLMATRLDE